MALVIGHVHVRLTAAIRDPKPSAVATAGRAGRKVSGDIIGGHSLPRSVLKHGEND